MGWGLGLGGSGGQSKTKTGSSSKLWFPVQFAKQFEDKFGAPPPYTEAGINEYMGPKTSVWQGRDNGPFGAAGAGPGVQNLGFGQAYTPFGTPQVGPAAQAATTTLGPTAQAGMVKGDLGGGNLDRWENSIFRSYNDPVVRELQRQQGLDTRHMQSKLAGAGLASSGTGMGQMQRLGREYGQRMQSASEDAVNRAVATRYGFESQQALQNAQLESQRQISNAAQANEMTGLGAKLGQERELTNAQLRQHGQETQAGLQADTNKTNLAGLDQSRSQFLSLVGLDQADLKRMDERQLNVLDQMMKEYMGLLSTYGGFGNQVNRGYSNTSNFNLGGSGNYSSGL